MRSMILSQCRDLRIVVTREDFGALTTVRARICWRHCNEWQNEIQSRLRTYLEACRPAPPSSARNFCSEYILWRRQWTATAAEQRPDNATTALSSCSSAKFPNVYRLLSADHRNADRNNVRV